MRLPCKLLIAAWASACPWNFTKAHPSKKKSVTAHRLHSITKYYCKHEDVYCMLPLLVPSGPLKTVHSSILPKGSNSLLTSSSLCCFPSMPTNNFLSSKRPWIWETKGRKQYKVNIISLISYPPDPCEDKRLKEWMDGWMDLISLEINLSKYVCYHFCPPGGSIDYKEWSERGVEAVSWIYVCVYVPVFNKSNPPSNPLTTFHFYLIQLDTYALSH